MSEIGTVDWLITRTLEVLKNTYAITSPHAAIKRKIARNLLSLLSCEFSVFI